MFLSEYSHSRLPPVRAPEVRVLRAAPRGGGSGRSGGGVFGGGEAGVAAAQEDRREADVRVRLHARAGGAGGEA